MSILHLRYRENIPEYLHKGFRYRLLANTYIASVMGVTINGAVPEFVEPDDFYNIDTTKIEEKITERTKEILMVHLYGQAAYMGNIMSLVSKYNLKLVEDCAQFYGVAWNGQMTGSFGDIGCFSFILLKTLERLEMQEQWLQMMKD